MTINTQKIELLLAEKSMTSTQLSVLSGISRQNISTIIHRGSCAPKTVGKIARALDVEVSEIIEN